METKSFFWPNFFLRRVSYKIGFHVSVCSVEELEAKRSDNHDAIGRYKRLKRTENTPWLGKHCLVIA